MFSIDLSKLESEQWISIAQVVATAFVGIVAGLITWRMQSKQIDIAKGLQEIARGQQEIARSQHETAATKLRLELFERRFAAYENVLLCMDNFAKYSDDTTAEEVRKINQEFIEVCTPIKYLFNEEIYRYLKKDIFDFVQFLINAWDDLFSAKVNGIESMENTELINEKYMDFMQSYKELDRLVSPFLHVEKISSSSTFKNRLNDT